MRTLFLDDDECRHEVAKRAIPDADRVYNAETAIASLSAIDYDRVFLDHDLGGVESENSLDYEQDGRTVAKWIASNAERFAKTQFIVHSLNVRGAMEMCCILTNAGLSARRVPFNGRTFRHSAKTAL